MNPWAGYEMGYPRPRTPYITAQTWGQKVTIRNCSQPVEDRRRSTFDKTFSGTEMMPSTSTAFAKAPNE